MRRAGCGVLFLAGLFFAATPTLFPQGETTSAIVGQVSDATHAAVAGAAVTITNQATGAKRSVTTNDA